MNTTYFQQSLFSQEIEGCLSQMKNIKIFFNHLNKTHQKNITFRARMNSKDTMHFDEDKFILSLSNNAKFDNSDQHFFRVMKNYDLIIVGYDSTAIYELLSYKKIPFLILFPDNYLNNYIIEAKNDFEILKKKKILFFSPKIIADIINSKKNNLKTEWKRKINSKELKNFSNKYSLKSYLKFFKLKKLIDKNLII